MLYSIAPERSFVDALARGLLMRAGDDPLSLAAPLILLPTRRACRALREAFLRQSEGQALILPRMRPIGDVDEDELALGESLVDEFSEGAGETALELPPAIPELRRRLLLAAKLMEQSAGSLGAEHAAWLAVELARFLDRVQTERLPFAGLHDLVPEDYAEHWQTVLAFLSVLADDWPAMLTAEGALDPAARRNAALEALSDEWRASPPGHPVIAAGSTGSIPATADLLAVVDGLPEGAVVLPGLDRHLDDDAWSLVGDDPGHPQHGLARLLARLEADRETVADWPDGEPGTTTPPARGRLVSAALAPAAATDGWRNLAGQGLEDGLKGVARIDALNPREEAGAIALVMREALETPGRTAALVTPDRSLARRVAAALGRWGIEIDDSAGVPLGASPPGAFLRLTADLAAADAAPVPLLAALKHPLAAGGLARPAFLANVRLLERAVLRGPRPAPGFDGLKAALAHAETDRYRKVDVSTLNALSTWIDGLAAAVAPLAAVMAEPKATLPALLTAHIEAAEALAASDTDEGAARLWAGDAGEAAASFVSELFQAAGDFAPVTPAEYPALVAALMAGRVVRPRHGAHPRLFIWGLLEARLQRADVMILGGLNEGVWPPEAVADPWMSRPMQARFGLPLPERRTGLTAHDFAQAMGAGEVVLTRAARVEGAPTVPSRWLARIEAVLHAIQGSDPLGDEASPWPGSTLLDWARALDEPAARIEVAPPAPRPPVAARPRRLSVTQVEMLMRDPYALYARKILRLDALDPIDADPGAAERGQFIHEALEAFVRACPDAIPEDAHARLLEIGRQSFGPALDHPGVWAFWWPRFERIAGWFLERERERRTAIAGSAVEVKGERVIEGPAGRFVLNATADRVDRLADGTLAILDYKTGAVPSKKELAAGFAPQLPLEAAIAQAGGFDGVPAGAVSELAFWRLGGGDPPGEIKPVADPAALADQALDGLVGLIAKFDDPSTPYHAIPRPEFAPRYNDYDHLERAAEWSAASDEDA
ncbi:MAG: double-strand break repair protein AddB [Alphaproteobacteria bacterium]|nr:double-strand break repair protein AddB [Alphaproteobacteria bacterium]